ncbi:MAG: hypothetical protein JO218_10020 [Burkholderiales bacterium]|nr:hypothetical protein [Burkholderiales bacterium]
MITCPKCEYQRKPQESAPDWQCPSCGVAYAKVQQLRQSTAAAPMPTPSTHDVDEDDGGTRRLGKHLGIAAVVLVAAFMTWYKLDPHHAAIPAAGSDWHSLQPKLDRLDPADRELVVEYLQRRDGTKPANEQAFLGLENVLQPEDFKAKTFADAIAFERKQRDTFKAAQQDMVSHYAEHKAAQDADYAPLRDKVDLTLTGLEIKELAEQRRGVYFQRNGIDYDARGAILPLMPVHPYLVLTFDVKNSSDNTVGGFDGYVSLYRGERQPMSLSIADCEVKTDSMQLPAHGTQSVQCASKPPQRNDALLGPDAYSIEWLPKRVTLLNGTVINYQGR